MIIILPLEYTAVQNFETLISLYEVDEGIFGTSKVCILRDRNKVKMNKGVRKGWSEQYMSELQLWFIYLIKNTHLCCMSILKKIRDFKDTLLFLKDKNKKWATMICFLFHVIFFNAIDFQIIECTFVTFKIISY